MRTVHERKFVCVYTYIPEEVLTVVMNLKGVMGFSAYSSEDDVLGLSSIQGFHQYI